MDAAQKIQVVEKYLLAVSTDNLDLIREIYADNATEEGPVCTPPKEGIAAILAFYGSFKGVGVKLTLNGAVKCAGNAAAFPFTAQVGPRALDVIDVFEFDKNGNAAALPADFTP